MTRELGAFFLALVATTAVGALSSGCGGPDCHCDPPPDAPAAQAPLPVQSFRTFDAAGHFAQPPIDPENATVEVTADTVVIRHDTGGVHHEVVYDVVVPN